MLLHKFIIKFWNSIVSCAKSIACINGMKLKNFISFHLTLWRQVYEYIVPGFQFKTSSFPLPFRRPLSLWHYREHQTTPFSKKVLHFRKQRKNSGKCWTIKNRGFSMPWSPVQDYNDQKRVLTLIKPAQRVKLTVFFASKCLLWKT